MAKSRADQDVHQEDIQYRVYMSDIDPSRRLRSRNASISQPTGQHPHFIEAVIEKRIECRFLVHVPTDVASRESWPVLVFLHGIGEGGRDLDLLKIHGPPMIANADPGFPFIVVCPQAEKEQNFEIDVLNATLDMVLGDLPADPSRVYLTGLSSGGIWTWAWASRNPERFAAIAPVCARWRPADADRLAEIPVWAFHGEKDDQTLPDHAREMVDAVNKAGGRAKLTLYRNGNHNAWSETYANPELYEWFLSHSKQHVTASESAVHIHKS